jgi:hypothetical protein
MASPNWHDRLWIRHSFALRLLTSPHEFAYDNTSGYDFLDTILLLQLCGKKRDSNLAAGLTSYCSLSTMHRSKGASAHDGLMSKRLMQLD